MPDVTSWWPGRLLYARLQGQSFSLCCALVRALRRAHTCEKLLLALIMAKERRKWPIAVTPRPSRKAESARVSIRLAWGERTEHKDASDVLPASVLGGEEGVLDDVLEHAGEMRERVSPSVIQQVG